MVIDMLYIENNKNINRGYRKLEIWQEAIKLFKMVKNKINGLNSISFKVKAQVEDSIFSVHSNIAEGYCRRHVKGNIQFNNIALASLGENYSQIYSLFYSELIDEKWFTEYDTMHYSLENKLINFNPPSRSLRRTSLPTVGRKVRYNSSSRFTSSGLRICVQSLLWSTYY